LLAVVLTVSSTPAFPCDAESAHSAKFANEGKQQESHGTRESRDKCKRASGSRTVPKGCPDGGERLPNDNNNKRSPLDEAPPLTPLVA
jgi:hypothetical protein